MDQVINRIFVVTKFFEKENNMQVINHPKYQGEIIYEDYIQCLCNETSLE